MSDPTILAGPSVRRLRRREGLTQAAMASRLGISPSYLNLIERNQRPLSARDRRTRQADAGGKIDLAYPRVGGQLGQDEAIDPVHVDRF